MYHLSRYKLFSLVFISGKYYIKHIQSYLCCLQTIFCKINHEYLFHQKKVFAPVYLYAVGHLKNLFLYV